MDIEDIASETDGEPYEVERIERDIEKIEGLENPDTEYKPPNDPSEIVGESEDIGDELHEELPEHEVLEWIGSGGNSEVYKISLTDTGRRAALKLPHWQDTISSEMIESFVNEADTWSSIDGHRSIVDVLDWGTTPYPWMFLEFVEHPLRELMDEMSFGEKIDVLVDVADGLEHAHGHGVVHLDLKPENILVDSNGVAKVTDWGLAQVLLEGSTGNKGMSPVYSAPERMTGGEMDRRTDVYQFGVVAYEMFTGSPPFQADRPADLREMIEEKEPEKPSRLNAELPRAVDTVVSKALEKEKEDRYDAIILMRQELREVG